MKAGRVVLVVGWGVALLGALGCPGIDNSGGLPPGGEELEWERVGYPSLFCDDFTTRAVLLTDAAATASWIAGCGATDGDDPTAMVEAALAENGPDDVLVAVHVTVGGCIAESGLVGMYLDGTVLRPWVLVGDSSYGQDGAACPADIGLSIELARALGGATATSAEVKVGTYNPDLPGAPALPGG